VTQLGKRTYLHYSVINYCLAVGGTIVCRRTELHTSPISAILAEIFIQHLEHNHIANILQRHHIIDYYIYVDDILIIYNEDYTSIEDTLAEFNSNHPNIQYTIEKQINNKLNYLDISIENTHNTFTFKIYSKPTTIDLIIYNDSCHPIEYRNEAICYLINKMNTYPISFNNKNQELQHTKTILQNNNHPPYAYQNIKIKTKPNMNKIPNVIKENGPHLHT
jgi:hypothetical protein